MKRVRMKSGENEGHFCLSRLREIYFTQATPFAFSFFFIKKKKKKREREKERDPLTKARLRCPRLYMTMQRSAAPVWNCTAPYRTVSGGKGRNKIKKILDIAASRVTGKGGINGKRGSWEVDVEVGSATEGPGFKTSYGLLPMNGSGELVKCVELRAVKIERGGWIKTNEWERIVPPKKNKKQSCRTRRERGGGESNGVDLSRGNRTESLFIPWNLKNPMILVLAGSNTPRWFSFS